MGILDFLRKKDNKANEIDTEDKVENIVEEEKRFVPALSFVELQNADWESFAVELKKQGILSNSYMKKPESIEYSIAKDNSPKVELTFVSKTSDSVRKIQLVKDKAFMFVNGAIEGFPETKRSEDLNRLWRDYQNHLRYRNMLKINHEGFANARRGARLLNDAKKMMSMEDIYDREQEFLEKHNNVIFDEFCYFIVFEKDKNGLYNYAGELPQFIPLIETEDGYAVNGAPVIPFSPRTLEHCILHMTNGQKIEDGEHLGDFEQKCRKLQKYSCFESEDWDKVIEFGKDLVRKQYQAYIITNEAEMN